MATATESDATQSHCRRKRPPGRLFTKRSDVYVSRNSEYKVQLERCEKMLEDEFNEITIHALGAAINRAIHLALSIEERSDGRLRVSANTSTVEIVDDLEPASDDADAHSYSETRHNSAIHIRVYKLPIERVETSASRGDEGQVLPVEETEKACGAVSPAVAPAVSPPSLVASGRHTDGKRKGKKRVARTEST